MSTLTTTAPGLPVDAPVSDEPGADKPDNCPFCGKHYQEGPETTDWAKHWHCWACGYDPSRPQGAGAVAPYQAQANPSVVAAQIAAQIREHLGLPEGVNLGDLLTSLRPAVEQHVGGEA